MNKRYLPYRALVRRFMLPVYNIEGTFDGDRLRMLVANDGSTLDYMTRAVFPDGAEISRQGWTTALKAPDLVESDADLVVVGANRLLQDRYANRGFRIIPKWVELLLPVKEDPHTRLFSLGSKTRHYFKRMIDRVSDAGFECEVIEDRSWFHRFYHEMYKPYTLQRFDEKAILFKPSNLEKYYSRGEIVVVKKNGEPVAGSIICRTDEVLEMGYVGVVGGDVTSMKEGAMFALHFFLAQMAHSHGCTTMNFGLCRPFMSDGTLVYKLKWHMDVFPFKGVPAVFALATPGCTPQAKKFLDASTHFYMNGIECRKSNEDNKQ